MFVDDKSGARWRQIRGEQAIQDDKIGVGETTDKGLSKADNDILGVETTN